jgi:hypothetical protein
LICFRQWKSFHLKWTHESRFFHVVLWLYSLKDFYAALPNSKDIHYIVKLKMSNNFKSGNFLYVLASTLKYWVWVKCEWQALFLLSAGCVNVALHRNINSKSLLQCYFQIAIMDLVIRSPQLRTKVRRHFFHWCSVMILPTLKRVRLIRKSSCSYFLILQGAIQDEMGELALNNLCNLWRQIYGG